MAAEVRHLSMAANLTPVEDPQRANTHVWVRRICGRLAGHGIEEPDWEPCHESVGCYCNT